MYEIFSSSKQRSPTQHDTHLEHRDRSLSNGRLPVSMVYSTTPQLQASALKPSYPCPPIRGGHNERRILACKLSQQNTQVSCWRRGHCKIEHLVHGKYQQGTPAAAPKRKTRTHQCISYFTLVRRFSKALIHKQVQRTECARKISKRLICRLHNFSTCH